MKMKPYNEDALSEAEWFAEPWTASELQHQFRDSQLGEMRREHALYRYWHPKIAADSPICLTRAELEELLGFAGWRSAAHSIIGGMAAQKRITPDDTAGLLERLPPSGWVYNQVKSLQILRDPAPDWREKMDAFLNAKSDWAVGEILEALLPEDADEAKAMIAAASRPKSPRERLLKKLPK